MVGILGDNTAQTEFVEEFVRIFTDMQNNIGTALGLLDDTNIKFAFAFGMPFHSFVRCRSSNAGAHCHAIGNDKCRIKTYAELTNQTTIFRLIT